MDITLKQGLLSVVLPSYNEEASIPRAAKTITSILTEAGIRHELLFVDDGSQDRTWATILEQTSLFPQVRGVKFSRNFGKEAAIFAGLAQAKGDCTVVMDCDLQHPPEKVVDMYRLWQNGYQVVEGVKSSRGKENPLHTFAAKSFYSMMTNSTGIDMSRASDFKLLDRRAVDTLLAMREKNAFFRALSSWIGFQTARIEFDVQPRAAGKSNWSPLRLTRYALENITSFTSAPMQIITFFGCLMLLASILLGGEALYRWAVGEAAAGFTTVILLQLFTGSLLMIGLGIIGYYIARIYEEVKGRPRYIISETCENSAVSAAL